jgi:hypothetical protein
VLAGSHLDVAEEQEREDPGGDSEAPRLIYRRCRAVELESEPPMPWNTDGELVGERSPSFRVVPRALTVLVGEEPLWERDADVAGAGAGTLAASPGTAT